MNCEPKELARIVRTGPMTRHLLDRIVTVDSVVTFTDWGACWAYTPQLRDSCGMPINFIEDCALRPIRDPGDDAVDESAAWLPPVPLPAIDPSLLPEKESA